MNLMVKCANCGQQFAPSNTNLKTRKLGKGIEETYYMCPICGKDYPVMRTNKEIRYAQAKLQKFLNKLKKKPLGATPDDVLKVAQLQKEFKTKLDAFNGR